MRLDKFLTEVQIGSRSQVKDYIKKGRISVNQVTVLKPEAQIKENSDTVTFDGKELRKLYTARIALDGGKDRYWLMDIWNMRSDYPAKLLLGSAKHFSKEWCRSGIEMCKVLDVQMKSQTGFDSEGELKLLLMRLAQEVKE